MMKKCMNRLNVCSELIERAQLGEWSEFPWYSNTPGFNENMHDGPTELD